MATVYTINDARNIFNFRAGTRGISANISPEQFNLFWGAAELKFFNQKYEQYSLKQTVSDSISKWLSDPMYIPVDSNGIFNFFPGMNLLHVDSLAAYLVVSGTGIATFKSLVGGSAYTDGYYTIDLTGGAGSGAKVFIVVQSGVVVACLPVIQGTGYAVNDVLTGTIPAGGGFSITVATLTGSTKENPVGRVEKQRWSVNVASTYDAPNQEFPIYSQYASHLEFSPKNLGFAKLVYLMQPIWSFWAYTLQGYIGTLTGLVGGSGYVDGTYQNVPLTGGTGNSALGTITVSGGSVSVLPQLTNPGKLYSNGDILSAAAANLGGTGTGFSITVSSLVPGTVRAIYDPVNSIQPKWNTDDINEIIDLALNDAAISARDPELASFVKDTEKTQQ